MKTKLRVKKYFDKKKELQEALLTFIDNTSDLVDDYYYLTRLIEEQKIESKPEEFKLYLHLIKNIVSDHHRGQNFYEKIERILLQYRKYIKQTFSNSLLFRIFIECKWILFFLIKNNILIIEEAFVKFFVDSGEENLIRYCHFFYPEIKKFVQKEKVEPFQGYSNGPCKSTKKAPIQHY